MATKTERWVLTIRTTWALGQTPWTPWIMLVRLSWYVCVEILLWGFWSLVPMLMTTRSAADCFEKSQGSAFSRFAAIVAGQPLLICAWNLWPPFNTEVISKIGGGSLLTSISLERPFTRITTVKPLPRLAPHIPPAILVSRADARERSDAVLRLAQPIPDSDPEARQALVRRVHAARQAVADELDPAPVVRDLDELLALGDVHRGQLHAVRPVGHPQLQGDGRDWVGQV